MNITLNKSEIAAAATLWVTAQGFNMKGKTIMLNDNDTDITLEVAIVDADKPIVKKAVRRKSVKKEKSTSSNSEADNVTAEMEGKSSTNIFGKGL